MIQALAMALFVPIAAFAPIAAENLPPGEVLERVPCQTAGHSYALYLPTGYTPQKRWPVIYCFDPGANGAVPVRLLREAAETCGWIVIGSNNSRNGPLQPSIEAMRILCNETGTLAIDRQRIYAAGFSGGAHMALFLATMSGHPLAGVLACSNGLPAGLPAAKLPTNTVFFTTAGLVDFNYWPVMHINEQLHERGLTVEYEIFPGPHTWPPADILSHALEWFEVQAMRSKKRPRDNEMSARVLERLQIGIRQLEQAGHLAEALDGWERLSFAWQGIGELTEAEARIRALRSSPELRQSQKLRAAQQRREAEQLQQLMQHWTRLWIPTEKLAPNPQRIASLEIRNLQRRADKENGTLNGDTAQRLLGHLLSKAQTSGYEALAAGNCADAILCFEIAAKIRPGNPFPLYNLACAHTRAGNRGKGLKYLHQAVAAGFHDYEGLSVDEDLKPLRSAPAFARLLEQTRSGAQSSPAATDDSAFPGELERLTPDGFAIVRAVQHFGTDERKGRDGTIFNYIDGGGVVYLKHGFRELLHAEYHDGSDTIIMDVYAFATPDQAHNALADEAICPPAATPMADGSGGKAYRYPPDYFFYLVSGQRLIYLHIDNDNRAAVLDHFGQAVRTLLNKERP